MSQPRYDRAGAAKILARQPSRFAAKVKQADSAVWPRIGEWVGQRNLAVTANAYTHVLTDETELDDEALVHP